MATPALKMAAFRATLRSIRDFLWPPYVCGHSFFGLPVVERIPISLCCRRQLQWGEPIQEPLEGLVRDKCPTPPFASFQSTFSDGGVDSVATDSGLNGSLGDAHSHVAAAPRMDRCFDSGI
jgi:hypothetical protein